MERWRAPTVLAWLEVALGMPQYGSRCAENIKSGKVNNFSFNNSEYCRISVLKFKFRYYGLAINHILFQK